MLKGFIFFREGTIPYVVDNYQMELFTDDDLINEFAKEYNFKHDYILKGHCIHKGSLRQETIFLVEHSMGSTCYLRCYIIYRAAKENRYSTIGLQSPFLDDIFRYEYNYIDMVRAGNNLAAEPKDIYQIPFSMDGWQYELSFRIGHDNRLGILDDLDKKGELLIPLHTNKIQECNNISMILYRLAMFMTSQAEVPFKRITLYKSGLEVGWFFCPLISEKAISSYDILYFEFDVMKYVRKRPGKERPRPRERGSRQQLPLGI